MENDMATVHINGDFRILETHLAAYGVAYIVSGSRISFAGNKLSVITPASHEEIGGALKQAVDDALDTETGWLVDGAQQSGKSYTSKVTPTVSPFLGPKMDSLPGKECVRGVYMARDKLFSRLGGSRLAEVAAAIGKPLYWDSDLAARGGSQMLSHVWNSGNDLVVTNFITPAVELGVMSMSIDNILDVLENGTDRTYISTEWTPVPSNSIMSLLALYGLWAFPTVARINDRSYTAGCRSRERKHVTPSQWKDRSPLTIEIPVFSVPVSVAKVRSVLSSSHWLGSTPRSLAWLREQEVSSRVVFNVTELSKGTFSSRAGYGDHIPIKL